MLLALKINLDLYDRLDEDGNGTLDIDEFSKMLKGLERERIEKYFNKYSKGKKNVSLTSSNSQSSWCLSKKSSSKCPILSL